MNCTIQNEFLRVNIDCLGAQLRSITDLATGCERLHQADEVWKDTAPNLFPLIGRLKDETYRFAGADYQMHIHGFAAASVFEIAEQTETSVVFRLTDSEQTRACYPFSFVLEIAYTLSGRDLHKEYRVYNRSADTMYYEVGGHEGYFLNIAGADGLEDYELQFEQSAQVETFTTDANVMFNKEKRPIALQDGKLPLNMELFRGDALVIDDMQGRTVRLQQKNGTAGVSVAIGNLPYLGIWTRYCPGQKGTYLCLEPWSSLPDANYLGYELEQKVNVRSLDAGAAESYAYTMTFLA